ncbi:hypothetical protein B398_01785 [Xylella fastidiosa 32]|uniref:Uncharacterized protein n=1 Tax=Xylella fastidiosa (strain 9a5c) TaxID=160492 RepID=Q9PG92_XYLFA|nr:hypothetical protein XF_0410 [Xylella fastidiosa 9a5c]ETE35607.1 hypothetical protein B398_01785 [Xylella fastidiosa 32]
MLAAFKESIVMFVTVLLTCFACLAYCAQRLESSEYTGTLLVYFGAAHDPTDRLI